MSASAFDPAAVHVILVRPRNPGNLGAVLRIMKNFGFAKLALAGPRLVAEKEIAQWACGADEIYRDAQVSGDLRTAITQHQLVIGTAGTPGEPNNTGPAAIAPENLEQLVRGATGSVALVFGPEQSGLTRGELELCEYCLHFPTCEDFPSLNLAQAVSLTLWELIRPAAGAPARAAEYPAQTAHTSRAASGELEDLLQHAEAVLLRLDFLRPGQASQPLAALRRLLHKRQLTRAEARYLRGIFRQLDNYTNRLPQK